MIISRRTALETCPGDSQCTGELQTSLCGCVYSEQEGIWWRSLISCPSKLQPAGNVVIQPAYVTSALRVSFLHQHVSHIATFYICTACKSFCWVFEMLSSHIAHSRQLFCQWLIYLFQFCYSFLWQISLPVTPLLCRSAVYSIWICGSWSSSAISKWWNFPGCWLLDACGVLFLIPAVCGFMGSGSLLAQVSPAILRIHFPWSGTKTELQIKSYCLWITTDNIVVLTDICMRDMKTAPFMPFWTGLGGYNGFEIWGGLLLDCIRHFHSSLQATGAPALSTGARG